MSTNALDRFLRYAVIDTQSNDSSETTPSTKNQFDLANLLVKELQNMGYGDAKVDDNCYVTATIPSNSKKDVPVIAFIAHLDTSPEVSGKDVKPNIIKNYQGGDIVLPGDNSVVIKESENPALSSCKGHTLITSDGTTLLGADDKAGVAAIMAAAEELSKGNVEHGVIKICFTPDEEIGRGANHFDIKAVGAKYAYTVDGEMPGVLNKETFSADMATVTVTGRDIHPGTAKNIMINSMRVMSDIISRLPKDMAPETTEGYEPFMHPFVLNGEVGKTVLKCLFRDFETQGLVKQKEILEEVISQVSKMYPKAKIDLEIKEQYRNMRDKLVESPTVLDNLWEAATRVGVNPIWEPIRGGTDGSRLTAMGLPTPNIYGGGQNFHSKTEWLSVEAMGKAASTLIEIAKIYAE